MAAFSKAQLWRIVRSLRTPGSLLEGAGSRVRVALAASCFFGAFIYFLAVFIAKRTATYVVSPAGDAAAFPYYTPPIYTFLGRRRSARARRLGAVSTGHGAPAGYSRLMRKARSVDAIWVGT